MDRVKSGSLLTPQLSRGMMLWYQSLSVGDFPSPCVPHPPPNCLQTYHLTGLQACLLLCHVCEWSHSFPWPFLSSTVASLRVAMRKAVGGGSQGNGRNPSRSCPGAVTNLGGMSGLTVATAFSVLEQCWTDRNVCRTPAVCQPENHV